MAINRAANAFIDRLAPSDRVAVAGFGTGAPATTFTADRARIKQALSRMVGQKQAGRTVDVGHNIALVEAQAIEKGDRGMLESVQNRECMNAGNAPGAQEMCRGQVEIEAHSLAFDANHDADQTIQTLRDLFLGLRMIDAPKTMILISEGFVLSSDGDDPGARHARRRGAHEPVRAEARQPDVRHRRRPGSDQPIRRSAGAIRRPRAAGRRGARDAVHRDRHGRVAVRADRIGDLRVLPARRRIGRQGQGQQDALGADRRAAQGRDRAIAPACPQHRDRAPRAGVAVAAPGGGGGAQLAAALLGAAASGRVVRAPGTGARPGAAADSRRRRHRLRVVEGHLGRLHHLRSRRPHGGQQGRRHAAAADHVGRAVAAPVHGGRKPAAGRIRAEARGRRRRSRRHRRAPDPRRAAGGRRAHAQRADGRRPGRCRRSC